MASLASCSLPISTNAKPRGRPVSRSATILVSVTVPCWLNRSRSSTSVVLNERLPTYKRLPMCDSPCLDPTGTAAVQSLKRTDNRPRTTAGKLRAQGRNPEQKKDLLSVARHAPEIHPALRERQVLTRSDPVRRAPARHLTRGKHRFFR